MVLKKNQKKIMFKISAAFTLAEVLITLGIIGVVAALTIPDLMMNTQKNEFKVAWKKNFGILANATQSIYNENGVTNITPLITNSIDARNLYKDKLDYIKSCDDIIVEGCYNYTVNAVWGRASMSNTGQPALLLKDGSLIWFIYTPSLYIVVDVNGNKAPNLAGVDIFETVIWNTGDGKLVLPDSTTVCSPQTSPGTPTWANYMCSGTFMLN